MKGGNTYVNGVFWEGDWKLLGERNTQPQLLSAGVRLASGIELLSEGFEGGCIFGRTRHDSRLPGSCSLLLSLLSGLESTRISLCLLIRAPTVYKALGGTQL